jgi:hypothetical protein
LRHFARFVILFAVIVILIGCKPVAACNSMKLPAQAISQGNNWTWLRITIGSSTARNVSAILGDPPIIYSWPQDQSSPTACVWFYQKTHNSPSIWLPDGKVIGISFSSDNGKWSPQQPRSVTEACAMYSRGEIVGWSSYIDSGYRSVVLPKEGVQADIGASGIQAIGNIFYFSPMTVIELQKSIWSRLVLDYNPSLNTDHIDTSPRDPFDWVACAKY